MDLDALLAMRPRLVNYFRSSAGDAAEDIVAVVLADAAIRIERGETILAKFVWTACRWRAINHARRLTARHEAPGALSDVYPAAIDQPDEGFAESTGRALAALTDQQLDAVVLDSDGFSLAETGERLGISADAVKQLRVRAHTAARKDRDTQR